jgi:hypothetical protein
MNAHCIYFIKQHTLLSNNDVIYLAHINISTSLTSPISKRRQHIKGVSISIIYTPLMYSVTLRISNIPKALTLLYPQGRHRIHEAPGEPSVIS